MTGIHLTVLGEDPGFTARAEKEQSTRACTTGAIERCQRAYVPAYFID